MPPLVWHPLHSQGALPASFTGLYNLQCLDLSDNAAMCNPIPDGLPCFDAGASGLGSESCPGAEALEVSRPPYCTVKPPGCPGVAAYAHDEQLPVLAAIKAQLGNPAALSSWSSGGEVASSCASGGGGRVRVLAGGRGARASALGPGVDTGTGMGTGPRCGAAAAVVSSGRPLAFDG